MAGFSAQASWRVGISRRNLKEPQITLPVAAADWQGAATRVFTQNYRGPQTQSRVAQRAPDSVFSQGRASLP